MRLKERDTGLKLIDELVAAGRMHFTLSDAAALVGRSRTATSNLLHRLLREGLIDRVRRGNYAIRQLGVLGTSAASQDILLAVGAGFSRARHRVAYRTALEELDLVSHASRVIQVAVARPTRSESLSGRPLKTILEPEAAISVGASKRGDAWVSDVNRALLDAGARPELVGGAATLAEAVASAARQVDPERLMSYARQLRWSASLRRIGSVADALDIDGLAHQLKPLVTPTSDIDLEPGSGETAWRDARWWVRWAQSHSDFVNVARQ